MQEFCHLPVPLLNHIRGIGQREIGAILIPNKRDALTLGASGQGQHLGRMAAAHRIQNVKDSTCMREDGVEVPIFDRTAHRNRTRFSDSSGKARMPVSSKNGGSRNDGRPARGTNGGFRSIAVEDTATRFKYICHGLHIL
ncbi:MAG: hypothetical protein JXB42_07035 [Deltaproteobacteria bacterium]|nr:hypothetical protein [Deltaproteobacteria bacterium]